MNILFRTVLVPSLLCVAACQPTQEPVAAAPTAATAPAVPSSGFDGTYVGTMVLGTDRSGQCGSTTVRRQLQVTGGRASMVYNPGQGLTVSGTVAADGSFRMTGGFPPVTITGKIENGAVTGQFESRSCDYALTLRRS